MRAVPGRGRRPAGRRAFADLRSAVESVSAGLTATDAPVKASLVTLDLQ